ncbi:hypothetical protein CSUI_009481 [Cystoisospora suis]|uniref:Uncharacterized protein n=1 Tax=Cystoisospora suis TaxID=483139 RepID=A0A2C6JH52_9APIC|nr:hypothetical protein CSUI_009481 [Cystoisospora suis]
MALTAVVDPTDGSLVVFGLRDLHMTYQEALIELHSRDHTTSQEGENGGGGEGHPRTTRSSPYSSSSPFPLPASSSSCSTYPSITHPSEHHHTREEDALDGTREAGVIEGRPSILPQVCTTTGNLSSKLSASSEDAVRKFDGVDGRKDGSLHDHPVSGGPRSEGLSSSSSSSTSSPMAIPTSVEKKNQQSLDQRDEDKSKESRGSGWMYTGEKKGDETTQAIPSMCRIEGKNDGEVREKEGESSSSSFTCRCHHFYYESRTGGCQERLEGGRLVQGEDPNARGARQEGHHHPHQHVLPGVHTPYPTNTPQGHSNKTTDMSAFFSSSPFPPPHTSMTREEESLQDSSSSLTIPQHRHELASSSSSLSRVEAEKTLTEFEIVPRPIEEEKEKEKSCFCCSCHPYHQENDGIHTSSASHGKEEESKGALFRHKDLYIGLNHPASQSSSHFYSSSPYPSSQHHPLFLSEVAGLPRHPHQGKGGGGELQTTGSGGEYTSHSVSGSSWNDRSSRSGNHRTSEGTQESSSASREDDEALPHPFSKIGNSKRMSPSSRVMSASSLHHRLSLSSASSLIPGVFSRSERRRKEEEEREGKEVRKSSSSSFSPLFSYSALSRTVALRRISTASSSSYPSYLSPGSCQTDSWPYHRRRGLFTERRCPFGPRRSYCSTSAAPGVVAEEKGRGKEGRSRRRLLHPSSSSLSRQEERSHQSEELSDTIRSSHSKASSTSSSVARSLPIALSLCYPSNIPSASSSSVCSSLSSASSSIAAAQSLKAMDSLEAAFHRYYRRSSSSSYHHDQQKSHVRGKNGGTRGEECQGGRRGVLAKQRCSREEVEEQQRHQHHERVSKKKMEKAQEEGCEMSVENEREMTERQRRVGSIGGRLYSQKASPRSTTKENTKSSLSSLSSDKIQNTRRGRERERRQEDDGDLIHRREDEAHKGSYPPPQQMMKVTCAEERRKTLACAKEKEIQEGQTRKTECIPVEDGLDPALFPRSRFLNNGREDQERRQRSGPFNSSSGCTGGGGGVQITPSFTGEATSVSRPLGGFENNFLSFKGKEEEEKKRTGKEEDNGEEKKKKENRTGGESGEGGDHLKKRMIAIPLDQDRQGNHHVLHLQHLDKIEEACIHSSQIDKGELSIEDERQANICNLEDRKTPMGNLFIDRPEKDRGISFTSNTQHDKERDGVCMSHQGELLRRDQHQPQEEGEPCIKQETFLLPVTAISSSSSSVSPHPVNPAVSSFSSSSCASSSSSSPLRRPSLLSSPVFRGSSANSAGSSEILFDATALSPYIMPRRSDHLLEEEEPPHNNSSKIHGPDANGGVCTLRLYSSEGDRGEAEEAALPAPRSPLQDLDHVEEGERTVLPNQKDLEEEEGDRHDSSNGNKGISDEKKERRTTAKSNRIMTIEAEEDIVKQHLDERTRLQGGVAVGGLDRQSQVVDDEERQKNRRQTNSGQAKLHSSLPNLRGRMRGLHHEGDEEIVRKEEEEQHRCEECHDDRLHCGHLSHHHHRLPGESIQLQDRERYHRLLAGSQSSSSSSLPSSSSCCLKHCHHPFHHISRRPSLPQLPSDVGEISHQDPRCYYYHPKDFTGQPQVYRSSPPPPLADLRPFSQCPSASLHLHPNPRLVPLPKVDQYEPSLHTCTSSSSSSSLSPPGARPRSAAVIARGHTTTCFSSLRSLSKDVFISSNPLAPSEERRREGRETHEKNEGGEIGHPFFHLAPPSRAVTITPPTAAMLVERQCGQIIHPVACRSSDGGGDASPSSSAPPSASERSP